VDIEGSNTVDDSYLPTGNIPSGPTNFNDVLLGLYIKKGVSKEDEELDAMYDKVKEEKEASGAGNNDPDQGLRFTGLNVLQECLAAGTCTPEEAEAELDRLQDESLVIEQLKFNSQCVLSGPFNIEAFAQTNLSYRYDKLRFMDYSKLFFLYGDPSRLMGLISAPPNAGSLLDITTAQLAELIPTIRLYKIYKSSTGENLGEVEFKFDNFGKVRLADEPAKNIISGFHGVGIKSFDWKLNATNPATVRNDISATLKLYFQNFNDLLATREGVRARRKTGTAKWEWEPAEYSYEELLIRQSRARASAFGDEEDDTGPAKFASGPIEDPGADEESCATVEDGFYRPEYYEIKAVVGWAYDPNINSMIPRGSALQKSLANQKLVLFLTLVEHKFDFTQEGTFSLEIKYRGRLEALCNDSITNVLAGQGTGTRMDLEKELVEIRSKCAGTKAQKEKKEAAAKEVEDKIAEVKDSQRDDLASTLIRKLEPKMYIWSVNRRRLAQIRYSTRTGYRKEMSGGRASGNQKEGARTGDGGTTEGFGAYTVQSRQVQINDDILIKNSAIKQMIVDTMINLEHIEKDYGDISQEQLLESITAEAEHDLATVTPEEAAAHDADPESKPEGDLNKVLGKDKTRDVIHVPWFYLGDLINVAWNYSLDEFKQAAQQAAFFGSEGSTPSSILSRKEQEHMRFVLGPISLKAVQRSNEYGETRGGELAVGATAEEDKTQIIHICLGDIPITLQTFKDWYAERVINAQRSSYPILEFVRDLINDLALVGVRSVCGDLGISQNVRIKTAQISLPALRSGDELVDPLRALAWSNGTPVQSAVTRTGKDCILNLDDFDKEDFSKIQNEGGIDADRISVDDSYHYLMIYAENADSISLTGDEGEDTKKGIYHLMLGADRGIVKEVNFQMNNAPYLREARYQQDSLNPLAQLAATYNCNMKLVGNVIFWPGQYVFVNPIGFGSGLGLPYQKRSVSNQLGLGGYHLVTKVNNFIEEGKFETEVTALFEASGDGCPRTPTQMDKGACPEKSTTGPDVPPDPAGS
jgi:hypothetical protein